MEDSSNDGACMTFAKAFQLVRDTDVTGISGTGTVADGGVFPDGTTVLRWRQAGTTRSDHVKPTTVIHDDIQSVIGLHGHDGKTRIAWAKSQAEAWEEGAEDMAHWAVYQDRPRIPRNPYEEKL